MLVLQTSTNHIENTKLLRCEKRELTQQRLDLGAGTLGCRAAVETLGDTNLPLQDGADRLNQLGLRGRFQDVARNAEGEHASHNPDSVMRRNNDDRAFRRGNTNTECSQ